MAGRSFGRNLAVSLGYVEIVGVAGDFNVVRFPSEKSSTGRVLRSMKEFNSFIEDCSFFGSPLVNGRFTWSRQGVGCRLDRFLLSKGWLDGFLNVKQSLGPLDSGAVK